MRLIYEHSRLYDQWAIVKATLDSLDYSSLICNTSGALLVGNEAALAILDQGDGLALRNGRISLDDRAAQQKLRSLLTGSEPELTGNNGVRGALLVARRSGLADYQLILRRIEPARSLFATRGETLWSVMITDPTKASAPTMRAIAMLYGLTPAEARLASCIISGSTPEEVAAQTGVKITTIRSQLSSLFAKTQTRRQAELVRLFSSVPALR